MATRFETAPAEHCPKCGALTIFNSRYCSSCGELLQLRPAAGITVPEPKQLPSGSWHIQLKRERRSITTEAREECIRQAYAIRKAWLEAEASGEHVPEPAHGTLGEAIDVFIKDRSNVLSASTLRSYRSIRKHRFQMCMSWDISDPSAKWQRAINFEVNEVGPKTVKNAWGLCSSAMKYVGAQPPNVRLPSIPKNERPFLTYAEILVFLDAVKGKPVELFALLSLNSLRQSEALGLKRSSVSSDCKALLIRGARVFNSNNQLVYKKTAKTDGSSRVVPVLIPRLEALLKERCTVHDDSWLLTGSGRAAYGQINTICRHAGLPEVGVHGLRHSFASLGYHLGMKSKSIMAIGGWSSGKVLEDRYIHNADFENDIVKFRNFVSSPVSSEPQDEQKTD